MKTAIMKNSFLKSSPTAAQNGLSGWVRDHAGLLKQRKYHTKIGGMEAGSRARTGDISQARIALPTHCIVTATITSALTIFAAILCLVYGTAPPLLALAIGSRLNLGRNVLRKVAYGFRIPVLGTRKSA